MFVLAVEHPVLASLSVLLLGWLVKSLHKGYTVGPQEIPWPAQPGPPHSWLWGHLKVMGDMIDGSIPDLVHPNILPSRIREKYELGPYFYIDLWPLADPFFAVFDPDLAAKFTTEYPAPKCRGMRDFTIHLGGPGDMVTSSGPYWKKWRSIFNPGFAPSQLMTLVPGIVDQVTVFAQKMTELSKSHEAFRLEELATRLMVDIIGKVTLDMQLNTQRVDSPMISALREQVHLVPNTGTLDPIAGWNPIGIYHRWNNSRIMCAYLSKIIDERIANIEADTVTNGGKKPRKRTMIDLALESYRSRTASTTTKSKGLHPDFKKHAITQIRIFIFAGHDTTSSAICYAIYLLQKHPETLARIREEHDKILGPPEKTMEIIKKDPHIVYKLEYTTAVIKEPLRLFPAASGFRTPDDTLVLRDPKTGDVLPTVPDMNLWIPHYGLHRDKATWGSDANEFDPSRFLPENASSLPEAHYRPFERGNTSCIGQDLAMIEARIVLAMVSRQFDYTPAFDALEELAKDGSKYAENPKWKKGKHDLNGEIAYPVLIGSSKPREGMPMWVKEVANH